MGSKLSNFNFSPGYTLDISSEKHASYEKDWNIELKNLINIDIDGKPNILADINDLPIKNSTISNFGCFNVLELLQFPQVAVKEIYRVLNKTGYLVGYVPFLYPIHNQPVDYWRFSNKSLYQILSIGGFENIIIEPLGGRFIVMYDIILPKKLFFIRFILSLLSIGLNILYEMFHSKEYNREMYPSGYFFYAKK
jgi:SAM-dependent methyltransferase|tara:strand:- start:188 stop:769 length:582 start_codon:yes stop_codon:yes gene_type:complete